MPIEIYYIISFIEYYYGFFRRIYNIIYFDLSNINISKNCIFQIAIKIINNITEFKKLIPILFIFGIYFYIIQKFKIIFNIIK